MLPHLAALEIFESHRVDHCKKQLESCYTDSLLTDGAGGEAEIPLTAYFVNPIARPPLHSMPEGSLENNPDE